MSLVIDAHDNLWIGLARDGISRLRLGQTGVARFRLEGSRSPSVCALHAVDGHALLLAFCGGSLRRLDLGTGRITDVAGELDRALASPMPTLNAHALRADGHGGFWIPTDTLGLLHWQPQQHRATRYPVEGETFPPYMTDALQDAQQRVWVSHVNGLAVLEPGAKALKNVVVKGVRFGTVSRVTPGSRGSLWLATANGLIHYEPDRQRARRFTYAADDRSSLSDNYVLATYTDATNRLWVGTQAGLNRMLVDKSGAITFRRYGKADGLPDMTVAAIVSDASGALWVGTDRGLARWNPALDRFQSFLPSDGVPDLSINMGTALLGRDGSLYFGSISGLLKIDPRAFRITDPAPVLSSYDIGDSTTINLRGQAVPPLRASYADASVSFQVAVPSGARHLSYRLLGLDERWQDMPVDMEVRYHRLPHGDYRFQVRQMDSAGRWREPALSVPLTVAPPPWQSRWAYLIYAVAALGALTLLQRAYARRRRVRREHMQALRRMANYDLLTGLPNRNRFQTELLAHLQGAPAQPLALLFIDLDRFKNVNDSLGHQFGDKVLVAAAQRLREVLPSTAIVARLGGDEFTVILSDCRYETEAAETAGRVLEAFAQPLRTDTSEVIISASIGISLAPGHATDATLLIQYADTAMYYAKETGRNAFRIFQPDMVARVSRRLALESALRRALERDEFHLVYQPRLAVASGSPCGAEVLLRWRSDEFGEVSPAEFIPILEDTGVIEDVGLWLLDQVVHQIQEWHAAGMVDLVIAINVSVHQLIRGRLSERLAELLATQRLPRHALELEITESAVMENAERMQAALLELKELELRLSIDDFGTGYSSFAHLSRLPFHTLKIDKGLIDGVGSDERANTLCAAIIAMAHNLRLWVVAEGVEHEPQADALRAMGCDEIQGYWYSRPLPSAGFERWLIVQRATT